MYEEYHNEEDGDRDYRHMYHARQDEQIGGGDSRFREPGDFRQGAMIQGGEQSRADNEGLDLNREGNSSGRERERDRDLDSRDRERERERDRDRERERDKGDRERERDRDKDKDKDKDKERDKGREPRDSDRDRDKDSDRDRERGKDDDRKRRRGDSPDDRRRKKDKDMCYKCGGYGHILAMCTSPPGSIDRSGPACYKCSGKGHIQSKCPNNMPPERCYKCMGFGHHGRECALSRFGMGGGGFGMGGGGGRDNREMSYNDMYMMGMYGMPGMRGLPAMGLGAMSQLMPMLYGRGMGEGGAGGMGGNFSGDNAGVGNFRNDMPGGFPFRGGRDVCFKCNQPGHFARECTSTVEQPKGCYRCGNEGHFAKDCNICLNCKREGHFAKDCPDRRERSPRRSPRRDRGSRSPHR